MGRFGVGAIVALAVLAARAAPAATLYDSGTPTSPWTTLGNYIFAGARVVFGSDVTLTGIDAYIQAEEGAGFRVSIFSDVGIGFPGAQLFAAEFSEDGNVAAPDWIGASGLSWTLGAGAYWVVLRGLEAVNDPASGLLYGYAPNPLSRYAVRFPPSGWQRQEAVTAAGLRLFGEGGQPLSGGDPWPTKVPEPAAWALLVAGFVGVGATLRKRRHTAVA